MIAKEQEDMKKLENVIETCVGVDMKPNAIRKVINSMVVNFGLEDKFAISHTTMYRKIDALYLARIREQTDNVKELRYLAFDERKDSTLFPKGQFKREAHCTMVNEVGEYIDHATMTKGDAEAYRDEVFKVIENTGSKETLTFIASDGTATNTGWKAGAIRLLEKKLQRVRTYCQILSVSVANCDDLSSFARFWGL